MDKIELLPEIQEALFVRKKNILLYGPGGVGKTSQIRCIKEYAEEHSISIAITSTTGKSALAIGGQTIHSWAGIGIADKPIEIIKARVKNNKRCSDNWENTTILVIDEVSMLNSLIFEVCSEVGKTIRKDYSPFGGLILVFSGDFAQLSIGDNYCFKSSLWKELNIQIIQLTIPYRFPDIDHFYRLNRLRLAKHTPEDIKILQTRVLLSKEEDDDKDEELKDIIKIYCKKIDVETANEKRLEEVEGEPNYYEACDKFYKKVIKKTRGKLSVDTIYQPISYCPEAERFSQYMDNAIPRVLSLKPNAKVRLTVNLDVDAGLVNGTVGKVLECTQEGVKVLFENDLEIIVELYAFPYEEKEYQIKRYQIPLVLAWVVTIHSTQGMTLKEARIYTAQAFAHSQIYVALARVRTLEGLYLDSLIPEKITVHPDVLKFEQELEEKINISSDKKEDISIIVFWDLETTAVDFKKPFSSQKIIPTVFCAIIVKKVNNELDESSIEKIMITNDVSEDFYHTIEDTFHQGDLLVCFNGNNFDWIILRNYFVLKQKNFEIWHNKSSDPMISVKNSVGYYVSLSNLANMNDTATKVIKRDNNNNELKEYCLNNVHVLYELWMKGIVVTNDIDSHIVCNFQDINKGTIQKK